MEENKTLLGTKMVLGGREFYVPALNMGQLRNGAMQLIEQNDKLIEDGKHWEAYLIRADVILKALKRNYPDLTQDELSEHLDLENSVRAWRVVMGDTGFLSQKPPELPPPDPTT